MTSSGPQHTIRHPNHFSRGFGQRQRVGPPGSANWLRPKLLWRPFLLSCLKFSGSRFTQMAAFDRTTTLESLWHRPCALSGRENSKSEEKKAMQLEKATKVLKRVGKAVIWAELVVATVLLLFMSQFFSYDVFVSKFHRQAAAANFAQPR